MRPKCCNSHQKCIKKIKSTQESAWAGNTFVNQARLLADADNLKILAEF